MTVTEVKAAADRKATLNSRGAEYDIAFIPKVKIEAVAEGVANKVVFTIQENEDRQDRSVRYSFQDSKTSSGYGPASAAKQRYKGPFIHLPE